MVTKKKKFVMIPVASFSRENTESFKQILNFGVFVNIKVAAAKLDHLGFYCKYSLFLIGQSENSETVIKVEY